MDDIQTLLNRFEGDWEAVARHLHGEAETREQENFQYRQQRRELRRQVETLEGEVEDLEDRLERAGDGDDDVTLTDEEIEAWQQYRDLGTPEEIQAAIDEAETAREELAGLRRESMLRSVADAHGYDFDVLSDLAGDLDLDVREVEDDEGETRTAAFVLTGEESEDEEDVRLDEYAEQEWAKYLPVLEQETQTETDTGGTRYPGQQGGTSKESAGSLVETHIERTQERGKAAGNPLLRE